MKIAFFISSIGDTDLALSAIQASTEKTHEAILISLAKTAQQRVASFVSPQLIEKKTLNLSRQNMIETWPLSMVKCCMSVTQA